MEDTSENRYNGKGKQGVRVREEGIRKKMEGGGVREKNEGQGIGLSSRI